MAEKYPESILESSGDQECSTEVQRYINKPETGPAEQQQFKLIDQSASTEAQQQGSTLADKLGLVTDRPITSLDVGLNQSETTEGQVSFQPDFADSFSRALYSTQTGAPQYNVSGDNSVIQGSQHNVTGAQFIITGDHNIVNMPTGETKPPTTEVSQSCVEMLNLDKCQEELRTSYLDNFGHINLLPWIPEETRDMESIFVNLELVRREGQSYHKIERSEELVNLKRNRSQRVNRVLVTGDAGSGKSTLLANIAYKWAVNDPQSPLSMFSLVFILRMKDIESSSLSLVDLVFHNILSDNSKVSKEGLSQYIKENAGRILFLIDGLDEDSSGVLENKSSEVAQVLHKIIHSQSCVILTSRPDSIGSLEEHVRHYIQVKLEGFSHSGITEYITKFFSSDKRKISSLQKEIDNQHHIEALVSIPVLLLMICVLWEDQSCMPKTKTELYKETIRYMWKRYKLKIGQDSIFENSDGEFHKELKDLLIGLGEVALQNTSISETRFTYTESDFGREMCDLGCKLGILKKERSRLGLDMGEKKTSVTFLHGTFHQFCAAFYLAFLLQSKKAKLEDFHGKLFDIQSNFVYYQPYILEFCCGIYPQTTAIFFQYHLNQEQERIESDRDDPTMLVISISCHLVNIFESQFSFDQCAKLLEMIPRPIGLLLEIEHSILTGVLYLLGLYKHSASHTGILPAIKSLIITDLRYTPPWITDLLKFTTNLQHYDGFVSSSCTSDNRDKLYRKLSRLPNISRVKLSNADWIFTSIDITNLIRFFTDSGIKLEQCIKYFQIAIFEICLVKYLNYDKKLPIGNF